MELVDKEDIKVARQVDDAGNDTPKHNGKDDNRNQSTDNEALERRFGILLEVYDIDDGGDGQQVEQMDTDGHTDQEADEDEPAERVAVVGLLFPLEDGPEHHCREERGHSVDFALDGREPVGVGEGVGQRADDAGAEDGPDFGVVERQLFRLEQFFAQQGDGPVEEHNAQTAGHGRHHVDGKGGVIGVGEEAEESAQNLERRCSRRVTHLNFEGCGDVFAAVPPGCRSFGSHNVDSASDDAYKPTDCVVYEVILFLSFVHL